MSTPHIPPVSDAAAVEVSTDPAQQQSIAELIAAAIGDDGDAKDQPGDGKVEAELVVKTEPAVKADAKADPKVADPATPEYVDIPDDEDDADKPIDIEEPEEKAADKADPKAADKADPKADKVASKFTDKADPDSEEPTPDPLKASQFRISKTKFERLTTAGKTLDKVITELEIPPDQIEVELPKLKAAAVTARTHQLMIQDFLDPENTHHVAAYLTAKAAKAEGNVKPLNNLVVELMAANPDLDSDIRAYASENAVIEFFSRAKAYAASGKTDEHVNLGNSLGWMIDHAKVLFNNPDLEAQIDAYKPAAKKSPEALRAERAERELAARKETDVATIVRTVQTEAKTKVADLLDSTVTSYVERLVPKLKQLSATSPLTPLRERVIIAVTRDLRNQVAADPKLQAELSGELQKVKAGKIKTSDSLVAAHQTAINRILLSSKDTLRDIVETKVKAYNSDVRERTVTRAAKTAAVTTIPPPAKAGAAPIGNVKIEAKPGETSAEAVERSVKELLSGL